MKQRQHTLLASLLVASLATVSHPLWAQQDHAGHGQGATDQDHMMHQNGDTQTTGGMMNQDGKGGGMKGMEGMDNGMMMEHMQQMHASMHAADSESGQSAFDLIRQVVDELAANPDTNWEQVNIDMLREHLVDMNQVTLYAEVETTAVEGGARYVITGDGRTRDAIKRMVPMHAAQIQQELGWNSTTDVRRDGVVLTVSSNDPATTAKIRGLGFIGFMVQGDHHTDHHIMMATGMGHEGMSSATQNSGHQH